MKKLKQKFYTLQKWQYDNKEHRSFIVEADDGTLFANGVYRTKIKKDDLPDYYIYGRYYKTWGYLSASGIMDIFYKPSPYTEESFKDDCLYLSYSKLLDEKAIKDYDYDHGVWGNFIFDFIDKILELEEYKNTDVFDKAVLIKKEITKKLNDIRRSDYYGNR